MKWLKAMGMIANTRRNSTGMKRQTLILMNLQISTWFQPEMITEVVELSCGMDHLATLVTTDILGIIVHPHQDPFILHKWPLVRPTLQVSPISLDNTIKIGHPTLQDSSLLGWLMFHSITGTEAMIPTIDRVFKNWPTLCDGLNAKYMP